MPHSLVARAFSTSTVLSALALLGVAACTDAPNAPNSASISRVSSAAPLLAKSPPSGPYSGVFADAAGDKLRSDARGAYLDDVACAASWGLNGGGLYQLRTIRNTGVCKAQTRGTWRFFTVDFGTAVADLDQDGVAEAVEAAPGRLLADGALALRATSAPVTIFVFKVLPDGSTTENASWTLIYRNNVPVSGSGVRVLQASPGNAAVDIYNGSGLVATVDLPFKLTLTPQ